MVATFYTEHYTNINLDIIIAGCEIERETMVANDKKVNKIPNA